MKTLKLNDVVVFTCSCHFGDIGLVVKEVDENSTYDIAIKEDDFMWVGIDLLKKIGKI